MFVPCGHWQATELFGLLGHSSNNCNCNITDLDTLNQHCSVESVSYQIVWKRLVSLQRSIWVENMALNKLFCQQKSERSASLSVKVCLLKAMMQLFDNNNSFMPCDDQLSHIQWRQFMQWFSSLSICMLRSSPNILQIVSQSIQNIRLELPVQPKMTCMHAMKEMDTGKQSFESLVTVPWKWWRNNWQLKNPASRIVAVDRDQFWNK